MKPFNIFNTADSKFYLKTATKLTLVPSTCLIFTFYSMLLFTEMNYLFFSSSGFFRGDIEKDAFYDLILGGISTYFPFLFFFTIGVFLMGLLLSYLVLLPFTKISRYCILANQDFAHAKAQLNKLSTSRPIVLTALSLFEYISHFKQNDSNQIDPSNHFKLKDEKKDYGLLLQYSVIFLILAIFSGLSIYVISEQLYETIVDIAITQLKLTKNNSYYFSNLKITLQAIVISIILVNTIILTWLSKNILSEFNGVTFAFQRDIKKIICDNNQHRIKLRTNDPGQETANSINNLMEAVFAKK